MGCSSGTLAASAVRNFSFMKIPLEQARFFFSASFARLQQDAAQVDQ
tara:strand:- start:9 stop:149 length:141 start_codon:yes stop_codon:yes gene_type:complete